MPKPKKRKAKIYRSEIISELAKRTGVTVNDIMKVMFAYTDIVKECVINGAEVEFFGLCVFSYKEIPEKTNVNYWGGVLGKAVHYDFIPSYNRPTVRFMAAALKEIKRKSAKPMSEEAKQKLNKRIIEE